MALGNMLKVAMECVKNPGHQAVWSPDLGQYVCPELLVEKHIPLVEEKSDKHPPISPLFKLVFLTATGGTFLFVVICVVLVIATEGEMPSVREKLVTGFFDLAKIGFGAVVGLLGGQQLHGNRKDA